MIQEISRSLYLLCQLQNTRTSHFVERACRSYFIRRTSRPEEDFTNYTDKLHSFQTLAGYSKLSMCSRVKYVSNVYFDWTWTKAIYFNSHQPSVNMYWSQLVIVSLSVHAYDISIDFYYPLDPREAIELSIVLVRWIEVFVGCGKKMNYALSMLWNDNQLVMAICVNVFHFKPKIWWNMETWKRADNKKQWMQKIG